MLTISGLSMLWQATPPQPSKEFDLGVWYALVVIAVIAFIAFYTIKRVSDIAVKKKTEALIREVGDGKPSEDSDNEVAP